MRKECDWSGGDGRVRRERVAKWKMKQPVRIFRDNIQCIIVDATQFTHIK